MKKYILVEWPISQGLIEMSWFNECVLHPETSANYFVPEELFRKFIKEQADAFNESSPYDNMPVVIREEEEITYTSLLPTFIYNKDSKESTGAYKEFVEWLTQTLHESTLVDESYEEIEARVIQQIVPVGVVQATLYNEWHKVHIKPGDVVQIDIYNDVMIVNGTHYEHKQ